MRLPIGRAVTVTHLIGRDVRHTVNSIRPASASRMGSTGAVVIDMAPDPPTPPTHPALAPSEGPHARQQSRGIVAFTIETPDSSSSRPPSASRPPSRWETPEFIIYGLVFATVVPLMVWKPIQLSQCKSISRIRHARLTACSFHQLLVRSTVFSNAVYHAVGYLVEK